MDLIVTDHHEPDAALPAGGRRHQPEAPRLHVPRQAPRGRGRGVQAGAGARRADGAREVGGGLRQDRRARHHRRRGAAGRGEPRAGEGRAGARCRPAATPPGLTALLEETGLLGRRVDSYHVAFLIAPRINAAGRMATPDIAARLLLIGEPGADRRSAVARATALRGERAPPGGGADDPRLGAPGHRERPRRSARTTCSWSMVRAGTAASSASSPRSSSTAAAAPRSSCPSMATSRTARAAASRAFDMLGALERCAELFERFGGHRQAAGFTIRADRIPELQAAHGRLGAGGAAARGPVPPGSPGHRARRSRT